jgi:hypothetical protein
MRLALSIMIFVTAATMPASGAVVTILKEKFYCDGLSGSQVSVTIKITDATSEEMK